MTEATPGGDAPAQEEAAGGEASIARRAGRGLSWSLAGTLATKVGSFAMALVLARLLVPADFGAYAVALAATHFVMCVNDVGLIAATVQWRGTLEEMTATAATLAVIFSAVLYAIFWFAAEPFATLAGTPGATGVVRVLTLTILVDGVTAVRAAALMRRFQQDKLTRANACGFVVTAAVTISLAASGAGAYCFAWGQVTGNVVTGVLIFLWARIPVEVGFDRAVARKLMAFGVPLAASLGVEAVVMNADYVIVGNVLGATALGFYLLAFNISSWVPGVIGTAVRYVSVAGFSRLSEQKTEVLSDGVSRTVPLLVTGLVPIAVLMGALAPELVTVLFGGQWLPSSGVLQLLMVLTVVRILTSFAFDILTGAGATRSTLWLNLGWSIALVPSLWLGAEHGGIRGAAMAHAIVGVLVALPLAGLALHRLGVRLRPILPAVMRPLLGGALALVVTLVVSHLPGPAPLRLILAGTAGAAVYAATGVGLPQLRQWAARIARSRKVAAAPTVTTEPAG